MYAIALELDPESLGRHHGITMDDARREIHKEIRKQGFTGQQGNVYFGGPSINAVTCVLSAIELSRVLPWFAASVRGIQMLRIEEVNDLMPAIRKAATDV